MQRAIHHLFVLCVQIRWSARSKAWVWDCGFESRRWHGCLSRVSIVCCQVEVTASGWSRVQRRFTEYGVPGCDHKASTMRRTWPNWGCGAGGGDMCKPDKAINLDFCLSKDLQRAGLLAGANLTCGWYCRQIMPHQSRRLWYKKTPALHNTLLSLAVNCALIRPIALLPLWCNLTL